MAAYSHVQRLPTWRWWLSLASVLAASPCATHQQWGNQFAVQIAGNQSMVHSVASQHGCVVVDQLPLGDVDRGEFYLLECRHIRRRSTESSQHHTDKLATNKQVLWIEQQYFKTRRKRDGSAASSAVPFFPDIFGEFVRSFSSSHADTTDADFLPQSVMHQSVAHARSAQNYWPDPLFKEQWYLNGGAKDGSDMNVLPAWQRGYSGRGVVVSILDDGIQPNHPDLRANYDAAASLDINDNDSDPTPRDDGTNRHGTRCAGQVAAVAGNSVCGVGVAPNASIGGVRMLDGGVNDYVEAKALSFQRDHIDVYSASWGPEDDGKTVDGPGPLARRAFIEGVLKGRRGKGSIFVWASGNGGQYVDNCNCDGYTNSIFTLSISSASQGGHKPWYLEECASTLASTYSSGTPLQDKSVATCDQDAALRPKHICTVSHTGTSASAPLAGGLCALALEANPALTWRDMQYIVLMTSRQQPLAKEAGWSTNGVGRKFSHKFGYGLMDGAAMVELAERWTPVPPQHICISHVDSEARPIPREFGGRLVVSMDTSACQHTGQAVHFVEHVQCKVTLTYVPRGNLRLLLTSPAGTVSTLLFERPRDVTGSSFDRWPFMSVHFWGERAVGRWNLTIINTNTRASKAAGLLKEWQLIMYGTEQQPVRVRQSTPSPQRQQQFAAESQHHSVRQAASVAAARRRSSAVVGRSGKLPEATVSSSSVYCSVPCVQACSQPSSPELHERCQLCRRDFNSECSASCEAGFFLQSPELCGPCSPACYRCYGPLSNQCLQCTANSFLMLQHSTCVTTCPHGYYSVNGTCLVCPQHCARCEAAVVSESASGDVVQCIDCVADLLLYNGSCIASCPTGTFQQDYRCESCAASCASCVSASQSDCVLCAAGAVYVNGRCSVDGDDCGEGSACASSQ